MATTGEWIGAGVGGTLGGVAGFFTGGPVGAASGIAIGGSLGLKAGGAIDPPDLALDTSTPIVGLSGRGAKIENAAKAEMRAAQTAISARLAASLRASDIDAAQRGMLRSGGQQGRRNDLRIAAIQASGQAGGSIALEKLGLEQRAEEAQQRYDLTVAQLEAQQAQATNALYASIAKSLITFAPDIMSAFGVGDSDMSGDTLTADSFEPLDIEQLQPVTSENFF